MKKETISLKDNAPKINFGSLKSRNYSVSVKYFDGDTTSSSKRIDYEAGFTITPNKNFWLLDIHKHSFWFDGHEPDLISELIADELSKTIYPVQVKINEQGTFLEISNFNHIVNSRWHRNKLKATEKYTTQIAKSFYNAFERNLENRNIFEKSMQYDLFWNLLFHPKYIDYGNEHSVKTVLYLAVVPYEYPIQFTGKQKINTEITDYHSVEIHFKSDEMKAHDYFIPKNKIASKDNIFMRVDVYYDLDVYYLFPMHTRAYFEVYSKDSEGRKTQIKRIEFSQYQQDTAEANKITIAEKRSPFQVYEEDENEKEIYKTYEGKNYTYQEWKKFEDEQYKIYKKKKSKRGFWDFLG